MNTLTAYARNVTVIRIAGSSVVVDDHTNRNLGRFEVIRGFAHFTGSKNTAFEGITAVVRGGHDGLMKALTDGLASGRDDRS